MPWDPWLPRCSKNLARSCQDSQDASKRVNPGNKCTLSKIFILLGRTQLTSAIAQYFQTPASSLVKRNIKLNIKWSKNGDLAKFGNKHAIQIMIFLSSHTQINLWEQKVKTANYSSVLKYRNFIT